MSLFYQYGPASLVKESQNEPKYHIDPLSLYHFPSTPPKLADPKSSYKLKGKY